jgi:hypothetical protein
MKLQLMNRDESRPSMSLVQVVPQSRVHPNLVLVSMLVEVELVVRMVLMVNPNNNNNSQLVLLVVEVDVVVVVDEVDEVVLLVVRLQPALK